MMRRTVTILFYTLFFCCQGVLTAETTPEAAQPCAAQNRIYTSHAYRFRLRLPAGWKNCSVLNQSEHSENVSAMLLIRDVRWSTEVPREDIPIMIFTHRQWKLVQTGKVNVSAAPFPPEELSHNRQWVFALPARYNYDLLEGHEDVERAMSTHSLHAF